MTSDPATLRLLLTQFQARYPTGCLISDLLQIHQNTYAVKVSVQVDGTVLATGMAAAEDLEQAEDRARLRALEILGISVTVPTLPGPVSTPVMAPPLEPIAYEPLPLPPVEPTRARPKPVPEPTPEPLTAYPSLSLDPIDLSDAITQTTVEIRRLGWTEAQGRSYLKETYGKRSRAELTNEELLEFLDYLQAQPSPQRSRP